MIWRQRAGRDIALVRLHTANRANRQQIDTENDRRRWHVLGRDLAPTAGRSAEIDTDLGLGEEVILLVELDELEGRTRAVALLAREVVVLVLIVLLALHHGDVVVLQTLRLHLILVAPWPVKSTFGNPFAENLSEMNAPCTQ